MRTGNRLAKRGPGGRSLIVPELNPKIYTKLSFLWVQGFSLGRDDS